MLRGGGVFPPGGSAPGGLVETPGTATAEGGTHPTGMHSCCRRRMKEQTTATVCGSLRTTA